MVGNSTSSALFKNYVGPSVANGVAWTLRKTAISECKPLADANTHDSYAIDIDLDYFQQRHVRRNAPATSFATTQ